MKIFRSGVTAREWHPTDERTAEELRASWEPGDDIVLDVTIDKFGGRHSEVAIRLTEADLEALNQRRISSRDEKIEDAQKEIERLEKRIEDLEERETDLREAFSRLHDLLTVHADSAPSQDKLIEAAGNVCLHYYFRHDRDRKRTPRIGFIRWSNV